MITVMPARTGRILLPDDLFRIPVHVGKRIVEEKYARLGPTGRGRG